MKFIRNIFEKAKPIAEKNKFLHTTYDALETFFFQPNYTTKLGVHVRDGMDLKRTMVHVVIAMQLCYIHGTLNIGHQHYVSLGMYPGIFDGILWKMLYGLGQLLPIFIVAHVVGLGIEFFYAARKGHSVEEGFLVSGALIPLIMPPDIPLWMLAVATAFAVIIAKEAFGGTGMNILNVALTARVFIFFAYPAHISGDLVWVSYDYNIIHSIMGLEGRDLAQLGLSALPNGLGWSDMVVDGFSGATPLALAAKGGWQAVEAATLPSGEAQYSMSNLLWGFMPGSIGEMSKIFVIAGAGILIASGIGSWRIMLSLLLGAAFMGILLNAIGTAFFPGEAIFVNVPWPYHFIMGSMLFAMAFMATDPVTAAGTNAGKLIYGFMIGAIGMIVRVLNPAYPEGWMLAILFMNIFAPLIDHFVLQVNMKKRLKSATA